MGFGFPFEAMEELKIVEKSVVANEASFKLMYTRIGQELQENDCSLGLKANFNNGGIIRKRRPSQNS